MPCNISWATLRPVPFTLRQLNRDDAAAYHAIRLEYLTLHPDAFGSSASEQAALSIDVSVDRLVTNPTVGGFVNGDLASDLAGVATLIPQPRLKERHKGTLAGMYIRASARGTGLADAVVQWILERARADGLEQVTLTVVASNDRARRLYERWGFIVYGIEPRAFKIGQTYYDQALMVRRLDT
jgi:ribosomal protein S18 acetylase RimI-like enzyme